MPNLNETPRSNRLHIGFFGRMNSGKSSLLNAFCGQQAAIVSAVPGTTTDPVYRAMEINGLGPCGRGKKGEGYGSLQNSIFQYIILICPLTKIFMTKR